MRHRARPAPPNRRNLSEVNMPRVRRDVLLALAVLLVPSTGADPQSASPATKPSHETRAVTVRVSGHTRIFSLEALQQLPRATLTNLRQSGTDNGPQGRRTWSGASLREVVLAVDPAYCGRANRGSRLAVRSEDGWTVSVRWTELCGLATGGEALYSVKGCNGCHGFDGEGAPKGAKRTGPMLKGRSLDPAAVLARLRAGQADHGTANPFPPEQLTEAELQQILEWFAGKDAPAGRYAVPENRRDILLAFERDGQPITGKEGLIQMVVGMDDFVGRFSHWVSEIDAQ
jgi:cytochrome c551/c552